MGNIGSVLLLVMWFLIILGVIPLTVWLIVAIILWFERRRKSLKWWGIIVGVCCIFGLFVFGYIRLFDGAPYMIAQRIHVYIPIFVHVLENKQEGWMDENQEYEVVRFNSQQMDDFVHQIRNWKFGVISPYSLINVPPENIGSNQDPMYDKKFPMPKGTSTGYYFFSISKRYPRPDEWYTTRKAYFLNTKTRILYVFYDDSQWG